jgi:hypothetical protein
MKVPSSGIGWYRLFGWLAVIHSAVLFALLMPAIRVSSWLRPYWMALVTLWFLWLLVLALHRGRSAKRALIPLAVSAVLLVPSVRFYWMLAPYTFGLPIGVTLSPRSMIDYWMAYHRGRADATGDLQSGHLTVEIYGLAMKGEDEYARKLQERYQIELRRIAGCIVDEKILAHEKGYNELSEAEIERRFGNSTLKDAEDRAAKHWNESYRSNAGDAFDQ